MSDTSHHASPSQRLRRLLALEQGDLFVVAGYAAAIGLLALATPIAAQVLVNQITFTALLQPVVVMMLLVLVGWGLSGLLRGFQYGVVELLQQRLFVRTAAELAVRLPRVQPVALERGTGPTLITRFFDVVTLQKSAAGMLLDALGIVLQSVLGLLVLAFYHPLLLAFDVALIACIVLIVWGLGRDGVSSSIAESRSKYAVADWLFEMARHPRLFHSTPAAEHAHARTDALLHDYIAARRRHFRIVLRQVGSSLALQALGSAALLGLGGALVIAGQLTIGQLVAAEIIVSTVVSGIAKLGKHLESYYDLMASLDKLGHLEELPLERSGGESLPSGTSGLAVTIQQLTAGYTPEQLLLSEACLTLAPGERVVISGERGSGKSLLGDLLFGLRPPTRGLIELDGQDLRTLELRALRAQIALLRGAEIFSGSLAENLRTARPEASLAELRAALQAVKLWNEHAALVTAERALQAAAIELSIYLRDERGEPLLPPPNRLPMELPSPEPAEKGLDPVPTDAAASTALRNRPEVERLRLQREQLRVESDLAKNQLLPAIDLQAVVSQDFGPGSPTRAPTVVEGGVSVDFPTLNRAARGRRQAAAAALSRLDAQGRLIRDRIRAELADVLSAIAAAKQRVAIAKEEVRLAREVEEAERTRFSLGDGNILFVNLREQATVEAALREIDAVLDYHRAQAAYRAALASD